MAGPWEEYQQPEQQATPAASGPWEEYKDSGVLSDPKNEDTSKITDDMSGLERVLAGIGKGFVDVGQGAKQIGLRVGEATGIADKGAYDQYTQKIADEERLYDQPLLDTTGGKVGRFVGNVAATAWIPGGGAASIPTRMATAALAGGASASLMPTKPGESRMNNAAMGAVGGGVGSGILGAGGKFIRGLRGDKSAKVAQELAEQSKKFDVPLTVGELRQNPAFQRIEQMLERVPVVGTRGFREKQATGLSRAAKALADNYGKGIDDVGEELQGSLSRSLASSKTQASKLYDEVGIAAKSATGPVSLNNLKATINTITSKEGSLPGAIQDGKILSALQKYGELENMPFDTARVVRSRLGQELRKAEKQAVSGAVSDEEVRALSMIRGAFERDLDDFAAREGGEIGGLYRKANAFYRSNVVPFKDKVIRKAGRDDFDTDQIVKTFVKNDRPQLAAKLMSRLDDKGKAAVKYSILQDAFDTASDGKTPFSPAKFATRIEKLGKSKNAIFGVEERKHIEGFAKLARAAERAGQYAENPPTGQRALDAAISGGAVAGAYFNPWALAYGAGASATLSKLLTTSAGRRLLTRASGIPPESAIMNRILTVDVPRAIALATEEATDD